MAVSERYKKFMRSPEWKNKRRAALMFYGNRCAVCRTSARLEVHHLTYARFGGRERMSDLRVLCHTHHMEMTKFHWQVGKRKYNGFEAYALYQKMKKANSNGPYTTNRKK